MSLPTVTPVLTVAASYVSGDYVGTSGSAMHFDAAGSSQNSAGGGYILGCVLIDGALQSIAGELWLFDTDITPPADSAAWTVTDAQMKSLICVIPLSTYYASAANSVCFGAPEGSARFETGAAGIIYGCFVTRGAPAYASGDLTFRLSVMQA
jgi:hypothetical protein